MAALLEPLVVPIPSRILTLQAQTATLTLVQSRIQVQHPAPAEALRDLETGGGVGPEGEVLVERATTDVVHGLGHKLGACPPQGLIYRVCDTCTNTPPAAFKLCNVIMHVVSTEWPRMLQ